MKPYLIILTVLVAIGIGLYAHELMRQSTERELVKTMREHDQYAKYLADTGKAIRVFCGNPDQFASMTFEQLGKEIQKPRPEPGTAQWNEWQCAYSHWFFLDTENDLKKIDSKLADLKGE